MAKMTTSGRMMTKAEILAALSSTATDDYINPELKHQIMEMLAQPEQHQKIKGYRDLSPEEIALMNRIKEAGVMLESLLEDVSVHLANQRARLEASSTNEEELKRVNTAEPTRWRSRAKTYFQNGLMALTRSVAQPTFF